MLGPVAAARNLQAGIVLAQDEVDHAANRVRAVDGRSPVLEDFHALDRIERNRVEVHRAASQAVGRDAPAVEEHQRVARPQATQVRVGLAIAGAREASQEALLRREVVSAGDVRADRIEQHFRRSEARARNILAGDHLYGQRRLRSDLLDARAGDLDPLTFDWRGIARLLGGSRYGDEDQRQCMGKLRKFHVEVSLIGLAFF